MVTKIQRITYAATITLLIILLGIVRVAFAQEPTESTSNAAPNVAYQCLNAQIVDERNNQVRVTASGLPVNKQIYIVGCVQADDWRCTTGNDQLDKMPALSYGENNYTNLKNLRSDPFPFFFEVPGGSARTLSDGKLDITLRSATLGVTNHQFFAVYPVENTPSEVINESRGNTLQYGTIKFDPQEAVSSCLSVRQDPYGTIFDSLSLEPIPQTVVTLLNDKDEQVSQIGVANPVTTSANGVFNFLVSEGAYKLSAKKTGYSLTVSPHPNFSLAYSDLYQPDEIIYEKNLIPEHRDIALEPLNGQPYRADVTLMSHAIINTGDQTKITGQTSHPLTKIKLMQSVNPVATVNADRYGFFTVNLTNSKLMQELPIDIYLEKTDLTSDSTPSQMQSFLPVKPVSAQETEQAVITIDPIPRYMEGYAYDLNGQAIPYADVEIKLGMSDAVYYKTTADENGFFSIPASNTPIFSYYLSINQPNQLQAQKQTVTEFAALNQDYLTQKQINMVAGTKEGKKIIAAGPVQAQEPESQEQQIAQLTGAAARVTTAPVVEDAAPASRSNTLFMVILIILVIVAIAVTVEFIKIKRTKADLPPDFGNEPTPSTPPQSTYEDTADSPGEFSKPSADFNKPFTPSSSPESNRQEGSDESGFSHPAAGLNQTPTNPQEQDAQN